MNTSAGYHQAPRPPRVPLDEVLIKLHPDGFHQEFEADGINVGAGGLSMRASVLPEVGSTLRCQLDNPTAGEAIELIGRVVWAHESGPHVGEFGIRFTHLSDDDQTRIEALIQCWGRTTAKAPTVRLLLDGVDSCIVAEVQSESDSELSVEQPLPFLAIGSTVMNESTSRSGHLEAVELKMDGATPKLVLSIGYEVEDASEASVAEGSDRDTLPEETPSTVQASRRSSEERMHDTPRIVRYDPAVEKSESETATDRLRAYAKSATDQLASTVGGAHTAVTEELLPRITTKVKELVALVLRFIGALRSQLDDKPRRKQVPRSEAARAHLKNTRRSGRRYLMVAAMACGIVAAGWGIYSWAASGSEAATDTEAATGTEAPTDIEAAAATETVVIAAGAETAADAAGEQGHVGENGNANAEYLVQGAPLPPKAVRGTAFGADSVPGGEKYVLRMSNPVAEMDGIIESDGFSVTIPGSLSLSQAGPIATAHPDVEHASILNRGDFSELTIRFVAGRQPAYRVEARGPAIEISIAR
ncbi:MAG: PilZ domain-containing protein [Deltaproteobacteria bacterium]|nr:PilZ domain-containing protein [Deltaproteobacteria bacterium]MBW2209911.1 PilZ domain-containing protein [Deltaproteobacteria bacterium]MBW2378228.1 PilZ domain-containing protein [Deltaproteobacteria bacterium]MBW2550049.1 PilZ domain-containing protein [Deltaproteobacteria bacterium]MBW2684739.1 PilZ domain-containing protein [Deltaproteobacteria bacterium]